MLLEIYEGLKVFYEIFLSLELCLAIRVPANLNLRFKTNFTKISYFDYIRDGLGPISCAPLIFIKTTSLFRPETETSTIKLIYHCNYFWALLYKNFISYGPHIWYITYVPRNILMNRCTWLFLL